MATRTPTVTVLDAISNENAGARLVTWSGLLNTDDGAPVELAAFADRSVQVFGSFGTGGNCRIQGSNNGTNWATLTDPQGNALNMSTESLEAISELARYVRPLITAGDGSTNLTVTMLLRRV
ncbi:MAG: hypothetical protein ING29_13105 [Azospirillum sp.]|jgi:hypothetical protein|nr:hypothetical protein [Azospirillum sp.]